MIADAYDLFLSYFIIIALLAAILAAVMVIYKYLRGRQEPDEGRPGFHRQPRRPRGF